MANNTDRNSTDKKLKLTFSLELFKAAKLKADREGKTLEDWLLALVETTLQDKNTANALDWGRIDSRIDSRIDQRTVFLERQLDVPAERMDRLTRQLPPQCKIQLAEETLDDRPIQAETNVDAMSSPIERLTA